MDDVASFLGGGLMVEPLSIIGRGEISAALLEPETPPRSRSDESCRSAIHIDAMAFGMGNCCSQITIQAKDVEGSRFMCDHLAVMAPVMMVLTAATPILKVRIAETDCR